MKISLGYEWTNWLDRDDPTGDGDYEHRADYAQQEVCETPLAIDARARGSGSQEVTHVDLNYGFWCNNEEQTSGDCADFEVRYCCPKKREVKCDQEGKHKISLTSVCKIFFYFTKVSEQCLCFFSFCA